MSTANLNVWVTRIGDACHITDLQYYVHVFDCEGHILEWCGKTFSFIPTKCGHVEIEIPPGCYTVFAGQDPKAIGIPPFGNWLTHLQVVRANCGDHVCVTLFAPSLHICGTWFGTALAAQTTVLQAELRRLGADAGLVTRAAEAVGALINALPADQFSENTKGVITPR